MKKTLLKTLTLAAIGTMVCLAVSLQVLSAKSSIVVSFPNFDLVSSYSGEGRVTPWCGDVPVCNLPLTVTINRGSTDKHDYNDTGITINRVIYEILTPDAQFGSVGSSIGFTCTRSEDGKTLTFMGNVEPKNYIHIIRTVEDQATGKPTTVDFRTTLQGL